jgi:hypothetical protein
MSESVQNYIKSELSSIKFSKKVELKTAITIPFYTKSYNNIKHNIPPRNLPIAPDFK